jgi:DNA-3-methyladenine glycosylase I
MSDFIATDENGVVRCSWGDTPADYRFYHDEEWGNPTNDDFKLFEKICLEGFQSGLSWHIILKKRENFRAAFANFDFNKVATYTEKDVEELLQNEGIVRHRLKIEATINNASRAIEMVKEFGSISAYIWQWEPGSNEPHIGKGEYNYPIPSITKTSTALSKDLKKRGWKFFGPTTAYAFMQAMGMVNDHMPECHCYQKVEQARATFVRPV